MRSTYEAHIFTYIFHDEQIWTVLHSASLWFQQKLSGKSEFNPIIVVAPAWPTAAVNPPNRCQPWRATKGRKTKQKTRRFDKRIANSLTLSLSRFPLCQSSPGIPKFPELSSSSVTFSGPLLMALETQPLGAKWLHGLESAHHEKSIRSGWQIHHASVGSQNLSLNFSIICQRISLSWHRWSISLTSAPVCPLHASLKPRRWSRASKTWPQKQWEGQFRWKFLNFHGFPIPRVSDVIEMSPNMNLWNQFDCTCLFSIWENPQKLSKTFPHAEQSRYHQLLLSNLSSTHYKSHDEQLALSGHLGFPHSLRKINFKCRNIQQNKCGRIKSFQTKIAMNHSFLLRSPDSRRCQNVPQNGSSAKKTGALLVFAGLHHSVDASTGHRFHPNQQWIIGCSFHIIALSKLFKDQISERLRDCKWNPKILCRSTKTNSSYPITTRPRLGPQLPFESDHIFHWRNAEATKDLGI